MDVKECTVKWKNRNKSRRTLFSTNDRTLTGDFSTSPSRKSSSSLCLCESRLTSEESTEINWTEVKQCVHRNLWRPYSKLNWTIGVESYYRPSEFLRRVVCKSFTFRALQNRHSFQIERWFTQGFLYHC